MKIIIKDSGRSFRLWFPTSVFKWKWPYSLIAKFENNEEEKNKIKIFRDNARQMYGILKAYIKANGHFVLVDAISDSGQSRVKITI